MIAFFIRQHRSMNLIFLLVITVGAYYFIYGQKEAFPAIGFDVVVVSTAYPGASAEEVDKLISQKIEKALKNVEGRKELSSSSSEGNSRVIFTLDPDSGLTIEELQEKIKNEVDKITDLPSDAKTPVVADRNFRNNSPVINVLFSGPLPYEELRDYVDKFERDARRVTGVGKVSKVGYRKSQVWIEVLPEKIDFYKLEISDAVSRIRSRNLNVSAGKFSLNNSELFIKVSQPFSQLEEIENIILRANDDGKVIYLKDVAEVKWGLEDINFFQRVNGKDAIGVRVFQLENGDIINIANEVKELVQRYRTSVLPASVQIFDYDDLSFYVKRRLGILSSNATFGLFLVFLCLILFFEFRITFWTTMGIPFSFCLAIIITYSLGITLNLMSMFGFIIVIGMIVDDAIIISENVYRLNEQGESLFAATVRGTKEMFVPILAIVCTTIVSFLPLITLPGIFGKFLGIIPKVVIITMIASFIECIFFLPGHIANLSKKKRVAKSAPVGQKVKSRRWFALVQGGYGRALAFLLRYRLTSAITIVVFSLGIGFILVRKIPFVFFPGEVERITITFELPVTAAKEQTQVAADQLEKEVLAEVGEYVRENITYVGLAYRGNFSRSRSYLGTTYLTLQDEMPISSDVFVEKLDLLMQKIIKETEIITYDVAQVKGGPPPGKPIDINITGNNFDQLQLAARELVSELKTFTNLTSITLSTSDGKQEVRVSPDEKKANLLGINYNNIGAAIRNAFGDYSSTTANSMKLLSEEIDVVVKYEEEKSQNIEALSNTLIKNQQGFYIPLKNFATLNYVTTRDLVERDDTQLYINVFAELVNPRSKTQGMAVIKPAIERKEKELLEKYPQVDRFKYGGEEESMGELQRASIIALLLGLFGVFFVLTSVFGSYVQPFIVMAILPFSIIGVVIGLYLNSTPIGLMPFLGIVALLGVVVNDSLVMVNYINRLRYRGLEKGEAIFLGAKTRLRPIIMTSLTTIVGLLPLAYGLLGEEPFLAPMAISFLWGIFFSTFVLIFFLPLIYSLVDSTCEFFSRLFFKREYFSRKAQKKQADENNPSLAIEQTASSSS